MAFVRWSVEPVEETQQFPVSSRILHYQFGILHVLEDVVHPDFVKAWLLPFFRWQAQISDSSGIVSFVDPLRIRKRINDSTLHIDTFQQKRCWSSADIGYRFSFHIESK